MDQQRGIIYCAHGAQWAERARKSIRSLRARHPSIPVVVYTGHDFGDHNVEVRPIPEGIQPRQLKSYALPNSPFFESLYLDADTHVCGEIMSAFDILGRFDMALSVIPDKSPRPLSGVPGGFPEFNGGVILYRKSDATMGLLRKFAERYAEMVSQFDGLDEPALRQALWESDIKLSPLPPGFNFRTDAVSFVVGSVKVLHGKNVSDALAEEVNSSYGFRMYTPGIGTHVLG